MFSTRGGFMGGLVGAGLLGMFLGYGLFGGLGGLGSILGLLLQVVLIVWIARMAVGFFRSRRQPAYAGATLNRDAAMGGATGRSPQPARGMGGGGAGPARQAARRPSDEVGIGQGDLDSFERLLTNVQVAYADEDVGRLRELATPEAAGHLAEELAANRGRGLVNHMADVKLLQGDLAEAWREDGLEYATAAMRYRLVDYVEETATGRVVEGDPSRPTEVAEHWTFVRRPGEPWRVSAIQAA
jgi:predicted lipid-binding transport protein (Tim44 family)